MGRVRRTGWRPGLHRVQQAATMRGAWKRLQSRALTLHSPTPPGTAPGARPERTTLILNQGLVETPLAPYVKGVSSVTPVVGR
jgi:hypothetical protein